jgi:hypothetical protein
MEGHHATVDGRRRRRPPDPRRQQRRHADRTLCVDEAVALLAGEPLLFEPGTQHRYSTWGWVLVSSSPKRSPGINQPRSPPYLDAVGTLPTPASSSAICTALSAAPFLS